MLIIDRKIGEDIYVGNKKISVIDIKDRSVIVTVEKKTMRIKHGQSIMIGNTEMLLSEYFNHKVRLGFDGPRSTTILRGELYENKNNKYIDNSTKQFPSGGEF